MLPEWQGRLLFLPNHPLEIASVFYDFSDHTVQRFNHIGGIDCFPNIFWVIEQGIKVIPVCLPASAYLGIFIIPAS